MLKRIIAALLTLMLTVILLPKAALAADLSSPNPNGTTIPSISASDTLAINAGTVTENYGTITFNGPTGAVTNNNNGGTIGTNNGTVAGNWGTVTSNPGLVTGNNFGGTVTMNSATGRIEANNGGAYVDDNYGTVYNKGNFPALTGNLSVGTVTNNYGTVYNNRGHVVNNGGSLGTGVVYNDHGSVSKNVAGAVHNYYGVLSESPGSNTEIHNYGNMNVYPGAGAYTLYQYWEVTIEGAAANNVTATGLTSAFEKTWVLKDNTVSLTPKSGYYFTSPPSATPGTTGSVVKVGEAYQVTGITADTVITVNGLSTVTDVAFRDLTANGGDTETTSLLTLTFDKDIADLSADDLAVTGATKGVLTKVVNETGVYTLAVSDITVADQGSVSVAVQKHGFAFTPANQTVAVRKFIPPTVTLTPTGSTRFLQGAALSDAVFRVTTNSSIWQLSAANFDSATLNGDPLDLGTPDGASGLDGSVTSGSVVVTLFKARLNGLPPGNHPLVITLKNDVYAGRTITGVIVVAAPGAGGGTNGAAGGDAGSDAGANVPRTGDGTPIAFLIGAVLLAGVFLAIRRVRRKKESDSNE